MAGTNDFKAIATGGGANVITQSEFATLTSFLANGYSSGVVASNQFNKVIRQSSFISAVIGQLVANANINAVDDGDVAGFVADLISTFQFFSPPPGTVIHVAMNTAPSGFIKANGAAISRTTYASLFAAIGTTFGAGDGSTTFNLPDLRGEFLRGWDDSRGVDTGRVFGSFQDSQFGSHTHPVWGSLLGGASGSAVTVMSGSSSAANSGATGGTSNSNETRSRNIALLACIKY